MVKVRPFAALRPPKEIAQEVSSLPYDVMSSREAAECAGPRSLLHITRPEIDFTPIAGEGEDRVFERAADNFCTWQERRFLVRDPKPCYYIYAQTMEGRTQYGIVLCACTEDYASGVIRRHELTLEAKEKERMKHILIQDANIEPVFLCFRDNDELGDIIGRIAAGEPEYDFISVPDNFRHRLWVVDNDADIELVTRAFSGIPVMYIADGHHRSAAAAAAGMHRAGRNKAHCGDEEYNFFMAVCFPESHLRVMDYNRVVRDLGGLSGQELLSALSEDYYIENCGGVFHPARQHEFAMYLDGQWYRMTLKDGRCDETDPVGSLDSEILSRTVLGPLLGITDLTRDSRISFVGGIRGLEELQRMVDEDGMAVAFALCPVTMAHIIAVADAGEIMPPKTTWFEPKLRSGLTIHTFF